MKKEIEMVEIPVEFLTELLNIRKEHFIVCDMFKIPCPNRGESWVGNGITERIRTYITSYIMRKSVIDRETGAAFAQKLTPLISDPEEVLQGESHDNK